MQYIFYFLSCIFSFTAVIGLHAKYWSAMSLACLFGGVLFSWFDEHRKVMELLRHCRTCPFRKEK